MKNILVIGAHFDDAELACGGIMAKFVSEGKKVFKLTLTDNVTNFDRYNIHVDLESSKNDSAKACKVLGVTEITDFEYEPCNRLIYTKEVMQKVESVIFENNIDTVFIHYNYDMNRDHIEASNICLTAARHCENIFYFQSNGYQFNQPFYPTVFFDISDFYDKKERALNCYNKEHNRFDGLFEVSLKRTRIWGYSNKVKYAEGFVPVKVMIE